MGDSTNAMSIVSAILTAFITHEGGHFLAALLLTGKVLKLRFAFGKLYVPRFTWTMPYTTRKKQRIIALAGFASEFIVMSALSFVLNNPIYIITALLHFISYNFYATDTSSDFKWF